MIRLNEGLLEISNFSVENSYSYDSDTLLLEYVLKARGTNGELRNSFVYFDHDYIFCLDDKRIHFVKNHTDVYGVFSISTNEPDRKVFLKKDREEMMLYLPFVKHEYLVEVASLNENFSYKDVANAYKIVSFEVGEDLKDRVIYKHFYDAFYLGKPHIISLPVKDGRLVRDSVIFVESEIRTAVLFPRGLNGRS